MGNTQQFRMKIEKIFSETCPKQIRNRPLQRMQDTIKPDNQDSGCGIKKIKERVPPKRKVNTDPTQSGSKNGNT